jgi:hypothetical protein
VVGLRITWTNGPEIPGGDILETLLASPRKLLISRKGEVTERLKVHDWKSCVPLIRVPGVRIPPSPPSQSAELWRSGAQRAGQLKAKYRDVDC